MELTLVRSAPPQRSVDAVDPVMLAPLPTVSDLETAAREVVLAVVLPWEG